MVLVAAIAAGVLINTAGFLQTQSEATGQESTEQVSDNVKVLNEVGQAISADGGVRTSENVSSISSSITDNDQESAIETNVALNDTSGGKIWRVDLVVQKNAGADAIDLSKATIEYLGDEATTLTYNSGGFHTNGTFYTRNSSADDIPGSEQVNASTGADNVFLTYQVRGDSSTVLTKDDDRAGISILHGTYSDDFNGWISNTSDGDTLDQPGLLGENEEIQLRITTAEGSQTSVNIQTPDIIESDEPSVSL
jgi:archaellin